MLSVTLLDGARLPLVFLSMQRTVPVWEQPSLGGGTCSLSGAPSSKMEQIFIQYCLFAELSCPELHDADL